MLAALGLIRQSKLLPALVVALVPLASVAFGAEGGGSGDQVVVTSAEASGGILEAILFYGVALLTVVCALGVCFSRDIVRMAVWLFGALGAVALLFFLLAANFIAVIQLMVYVGGTLILLIFGVMLTSKSPWVRFEPRRWELIGAGVVCVALLATLCVVLGRTVWHGVEGLVPGVPVVDLGRMLLTTYLVPFEAAGVLLMIVMVGAAHLARQEKKG